MTQNTSSRTAFPLCWPEGRTRTPSYRRERSRFDTSFAAARSKLAQELDRLGARNVILSTNIELRLDGQPYANRNEPHDRGVAVYFSYTKREMAFASDRWDKVGDNIHAIAKTIEALRGIARWGTGDMLQAAFTGFAALPDPASARIPHWREVLGCVAARNREEIDNSYRLARSRAHPDKPGGSAAAFNQVQLAYEQACREFSA